MIKLTLPASCSDNPNFALRIVLIFAPGNSIYELVYASDNYRNSGAWTIDNVTFSTSTLDVNQNSIAALNVYPNPTRNGKVYTTSNSTLDKNIIVFDNLGKKVLQTTINTKELNISSLSADVYTIKISNSGAITTRKLIVQ